MARGGGQKAPSSSPAIRAFASSRVNQRTASSSASSGTASPSATSAIRPIIREFGKGQGWLE